MRPSLQIQFNTKTINGFDLNGTLYVPMLPIIEHLGMDWPSEICKINGKFHASAEIIKSVDKQGNDTHFLCLPLSKLTSFLMCINICNVKVEFIKPLNDFQNECKKLLSHNQLTPTATYSRLLSSLVA